MFPFSFLADDPNGMMQKIADIENLKPQGFFYETLQPITLLLIVALSLVMVITAIFRLSDLKKKNGQVSLMMKIYCLTFAVVFLFVALFIGSKFMDLVKASSLIKAQYVEKVIPEIMSKNNIQDYKEVLKCDRNLVDKEYNFFPNNFCLELRDLTLNDGTKKNEMKFIFNEKDELVLFR